MINVPRAKSIRDEGLYLPSLHTWGLGLGLGLNNCAIYSGALRNSMSSTTFLR